QAEDGIRDATVTGVQTCALPIYALAARRAALCPDRSVHLDHVGRSGAGVQPVDVLGDDRPYEAATLELREREMAGVRLRPAQRRSEERRVGKEGSTAGRSSEM